MPREKAQAAPTARPKVPMRRLGADCFVVVMKWVYRARHGIIVCWHAAESPCGTKRPCHPRTLVIGNKSRTRGFVSKKKTEGVMSLGLKAADYLTMLNDEYAEYKAQPLSMRKAINCCALANSLPEIVYAQYGS